MSTLNSKHTDALRILFKILLAWSCGGMSDNDVVEGVRSAGRILADVKTD